MFIRVHRRPENFLVGLGRIELPTSPLSGVRSSHLSYGPRCSHTACCPTSGGAGRDRTGDLLNANQALSQLSYSPLARNLRHARVPPGDKQGIRSDLKKFFSRPVGCRDRETSPRPFQKISLFSKWRSEAGSPDWPKPAWRLWSGTAIYYSLHAVHSGATCFRRLHPRSLLERR